MKNTFKTTQGVIVLPTNLDDGLISYHEIKVTRDTPSRVELDVFFAIDSIVYIEPVSGVEFEAKVFFETHLVSKMKDGVVNFNYQLKEQLKEWKLDNLSSENKAILESNLENLNRLDFGSVNELPYLTWLLMSAS